MGGEAACRRRRRGVGEKTGARVCLPTHERKESRCSASHHGLTGAEAAAMMSRRRVCLPAPGSSLAIRSGHVNWGLTSRLHKGASIILGAWVFICCLCEDPYLMSRVERNGVTF